MMSRMFTGAAVLSAALLCSVGARPVAAQQNPTLTPETEAYVTSETPVGNETTAELPPLSPPESPVLGLQLYSLSGAPGAGWGWAEMYYWNCCWVTYPPPNQYAPPNVGMYGLYWGRYVSDLESNNNTSTVQVTVGATASANGQNSAEGVDGFIDYVNPDQPAGEVIEVANYQPYVSSLPVTGLQSLFPNSSGVSTETASGPWQTAFHVGLPPSNLFVLSKSEKQPWGNGGYCLIGISQFVNQMHAYSVSCTSSSIVAGLTGAYLLPPTGYSNSYIWAVGNTQ